ncbi:unnamed protein product [Ectocarpus sp. CCAP 1310/34]|nr:unnamed protein product [Ectocarpus sp. CCAP 1310/34]
MSAVTLGSLSNSATTTMSIAAKNKLNSSGSRLHPCRRPWPTSNHSGYCPSSVVYKYTSKQGKGAKKISRAASEDSGRESYEDSGSEYDPTAASDDESCTLDPNEEDSPSPDLLAPAKRRRPGPPLRYIDHSPRPVTDRSVTEDSAAATDVPSSRANGIPAAMGVLPSPAYPRCRPLAAPVACVTTASAHSASSGGYGIRSGSCKGAPAPAASGAGTPSASFTQIGRASSQPRGTGGGGEAMALTSGMSGQVIYQAINAAGMSQMERAALLGILMSTVAPIHQQRPVVGAKPARRPVRGERASNGIVAALFSVFSYAFIGQGKTRFSGGQPCHEKNNVFLAAAALVYVGAQEGDPDWVGTDLGEWRSVFGIHRFKYAHRHCDPEVDTSIFVHTRVSLAVKVTDTATSSVCGSSFNISWTAHGGKTDVSGPEVSNEDYEEILVRETPFDRPDDVLVEASDLEEYLNNMSP